MLLDRVMGRICSELDRASSSLHLQAFTLLLWVRWAAYQNRVNDTYHPQPSNWTSRSCFAVYLVI